MTKQEAGKETILHYAREHFMRSGFSHVTTDSIAGELGISKKTLYKHFPSKEKLVQIVVEEFAQECIGTIDQIVKDKNADFLSKIKRMMGVIVKQYSEVSEPFARDLKRSMPDFYTEMLEKRKKAILEQFGQMVREGIRKRIFKRDFHPEIILLVYLHSMQNIIVADTLARLPLTASQIFEMISRIIYEGIITPEARMKYHG